MCSGAILPKLLLFALPLIGSSILQLLFNAADVVVVGRFAGDNALAAVGSTGSLINLIVNMFAPVANEEFKRILKKNNIIPKKYKSYKILFNVNKFGNNLSMCLDYTFSKVYNFKNFSKLKIVMPLKGLYI